MNGETMCLFAGVEASLVSLVGSIATTREVLTKLRGYAESDAAESAGHASGVLEYHGCEISGAVENVGELIFQLTRHLKEWGDGEAAAVEAGERRVSA